MEKILDYLEDRRAGRNFLQFLKINRNNDEPSYFQVVVGRSSRKLVGDYRMYFRSADTPGFVINNFAFQEMVKLGPMESINFVKYHYSESDNKSSYLEYLQTAIPNRLKSYSRKEKDTLGRCLDWANDQIKSLDNQTITFDEFNFKVEAFESALIEKLDENIPRIDLPSIETADEEELDQFIFLLLSLSHYHINNNTKNGYFFKKVYDTDIASILYHHFAFFKEKKLNTVTSRVEKCKKIRSDFNIEQIDKDIKKLLMNFKSA